MCIKSSGNGKITLLFTDIGKSCPRRTFLTNLQYIDTCKNSHVTSSPASEHQDLIFSSNATKSTDGGIRISKPRK